MGEVRCGVIMISKHRSGCPKWQSSGKAAQSRKANAVNSDNRYTGSRALTLNTRTSEAMMKAPATSPVMYGYRTINMLHSGCMRGLIGIDISFQVRQHFHDDIGNCVRHVIEPPCQCPRNRPAGPCPGAVSALPRDCSGKTPGWDHLDLRSTNHQRFALAWDRPPRRPASGHG